MQQLTQLCSCITGITEAAAFWRLWHPLHKAVVDIQIHYIDLNFVLRIFVNGNDPFPSNWPTNFHAVWYIIYSHYIAVRYNTILHPAQRLRMWNFSQALNSRKTPIPRPNGRVIGVFRELFEEKWPRDIGSALYSKSACSLCFVAPWVGGVLAAGQPYIQHNENYRKIFNITRTKSPNLNVSRLVLQLSLPNPMKPDVKSRMKM